MPFGSALPDLYADDPSPLPVVDDNIREQTSEDINDPEAILKCALNDDLPWRQGASPELLDRLEVLQLEAADLLPALFEKLQILTSDEEENASKHYRLTKNLEARISNSVNENDILVKRCLTLEESEARILSDHDRMETAFKEAAGQLQTSREAYGNLQEILSDTRKRIVQSSLDRKQYLRFVIPALVFSVLAIITLLVTR